MWAAAIAAMSASTRKLWLPSPTTELGGDDPLSSAVADAARMHEDSIAASVRELRVENEAVLTELQRAIATRLELG